jgi:NADH-quinone oxidoreductase subunit C
MTPEQIHQKLTAAGLRAEFKASVPDPHLEVPREELERVTQTLASDPDLAFDSLMCLSGLDWPEYLEVVYNLHSMRHNHKITLKVRCPKDNPVVPTVSRLWPTADWHEREAYDLIGVRFEGHPDLRRILLPEDWEGHPLRKDYTPPKFWHDIPVTVQSPDSSK